MAPCLLLATISLLSRFFQVETASVVFPLFLPFQVGKAEWKSTIVPDGGDAEQTGLFIFNLLIMKGTIL